MKTNIQLGTKAFYKENELCNYVCDLICIYVEYRYRWIGLGYGEYIKDFLKNCKWFNGSRVEWLKFLNCLIFKL